jgi:hypothetical protein
VYRHFITPFLLFTALAFFKFAYGFLGGGDHSFHLLDKQNNEQMPLQPFSPPLSTHSKKPLSSNLYLAFVNVAALIPERSG